MLREARPKFGEDVRTGLRRTSELRTSNIDHSFLSRQQQMVIYVTEVSLLMVRVWFRPICFVLLKHFVERTYIITLALCRVRSYN